MSSSTENMSNEIPEGVKGWSWGAFLLSWIWAIGNRTWIGLLAIIPYVGLIVAIYLGIKGRELAWKNKQWDSLEHFNRVQKRWSIWSLIIIVGFCGLGILAAITIPAYQTYTAKAQMAQVAQFGQGATLAVTSYYDEHKKIPNSLADAGFTTPAPNSIQDVIVKPENGLIIMTMAKAPLVGKSLIFVPEEDANKQLTWSCISQDIPSTYLPKHCKYQS